MKIATALSPATFGSLGRFVVWDDLANVEDIAIPETANTIQHQPDFPSWRRGDFSRTYVLGGHTENLVFTEHKWLLRIGINPPSAPIVTPGPPVENQVGVAAGAAPGLTGGCSFALRFRDTLHARRSPLGAASPEIILANQGATFAGVPAAPVPNDPCVDVVEVWVSVDGGLFRHLADRDLGAAAFTVHDTATGEAYTEELTAYPKVAFGDTANDRLFSAGDPRHPERVYVSELGQPEEYGGVFIPTRNGEAVIAIKNVGGSVIYVQCEGSSYYIQGFGPADFIMRTLKRNIGGFGQRSIALWDDVATIPTQRGWYRYDGSSFVPIGVGDWDETWRTTVSDPYTSKQYAGGFSVADHVTGSIKYIAPHPTAESSARPGIIGFPGINQDGAALGPLPTFVNNYWVINAAGLVPELGGSGQAELSFDLVLGKKHTCSSMLYDPGNPIGGLYTGTSFGDIIIENQKSKTDKQSDGDGGETELSTYFVWHSQHDRIVEIGDNEDSAQVTDLWLNYQCENLESVIGIWSGNEFAWQSGDVSGASPSPAVARFAPTEEFTIDMGREFASDTSGLLNSRVPRDRVFLGSLSKCSGTCVSVRLTVTQTQDDIDDFPQVLQSQRAEVVFTGWGFVANQSQEKRPLAPAQSE